MEKQVSEGSLHKWFKGSKSKDGKGGWVNVVTGGTCASDEPGEGTPKCVSSAKRASMTKAERLSAARRKKKADPGQQQKSGAAKPTYVSTDSPRKKKKKMNEGWSDKYKQSIDCDNPKGFSQKAHCQGKKKMKETYERSLTPLTEKAKKCWPGYEKKGTKKMFGKTYNNCVKKEEVEMESVKYRDPKTGEMKTGGNEHLRGLPKKPITLNLPRKKFKGDTEGAKYVPNAKPNDLKDPNIFGPGPRTGQGSPSPKLKPVPMPEVKLKDGDKKPVKMPEAKPPANRKPPVKMPQVRLEDVEIQESDKKGKGSGTKDACYHKVKSRYSVWPSAYASGALVKCRKVGAANWGNSSKKEAFSDWKSEFIWEDGDSTKKISELDRLKNAIKTGMMDGKKLSPKELEGIKAGLTQGGNKIDEGLMDSIKDVGKKVIRKTKEFINKPIIRDYPTKKEYEDSVKSGTSNKYESVECEKSNWRDDLGEDWQKTNRQDKTDGMSKAAVKAYRRENPGSKLKTAVTKKPSSLKRGSKDAKRRKSFCSRMKGMKKRLTSAKTARDPDSRINKALRRWNC